MRKILSYILTMKALENIKNWGNIHIADNSVVYRPERFEAVEQIISSLPEIDAGNLTSLPWILNALRLLTEQNYKEEFQSIVPNVLPLVCNVAACEPQCAVRCGICGATQGRV